MKKITQHLKVAVLMGLVAIGMACPQQASAAEKTAEMWCLKTNTGNYYPMVNVSMTVVPDEGQTFEIVLKYGQGEAGVSSISFEKHRETVDFSKYTEEPDEPSIALGKKIYVLTNTGKYFLLKTMPTLIPVQGTDKFNVLAGTSMENNVSRIWFYRGDNPEEGFVGIKAPSVKTEENLSLMTPISYQLQVSGCGEAKTAVVYSANGKQVAQAPVADGVTTVQVGHLTKGIYVLKVGHKSLKFVKK